jgi:predicted kinase
MSRLIVLNGPPGVGKSTVAARYGAEHPGTLVCDIDVLRTFVSGWDADYTGAGARIRPAALAMIGAYLRHSGDVVLPQLLAREEELDRFVSAGTDAGAEVVEVLLAADVETCVRRFAARDLASPHRRASRAAVDAAGGDGVVREYHAALHAMVARRPWTHVVTAHEGDVDGTYAAALAAVT